MVRVGGTLWKLTSHLDSPEDNICRVTSAQGGAPGGGLDASAVPSGGVVVSLAGVRGPCLSR